MNWIDMLNTAACLLLLLYLLAAAMPVKKWRHRSTLCLMAAAVALQTVSPLLDWIPQIAWPGALLNVSLAVIVTMWRKPLWHLIRAKFDPDSAPRARATDRRQPA